MKAASVSYRADIDGLRALAVVVIVIYHFNKRLMPGGFAAIELFFVLSGYLITRNIWAEIERKEFSLSRFYVRRVRRIAPAFVVSAAVTFVAGALLLLPGDLARLGSSSLWAALSMSNVYFWRSLDTGYFAAASEGEPLLHTWSLGVEEQFYLLWPAALVAIALLPRRRWLAISFAGIMCVASFVCGELTNVTSQKFSYFMLPARAGELMFGVVLALVRAGSSAPGSASTTRQSRASRLGVEALALVGFGLVAYTLIRLNDGSPYPGRNALFPCIGTVMVMQAGEWRSRIVNALLTTKPVIFIGLISYPLYLWHWPILAFIRYFYGTVSLLHSLIAVPAMLVLAILTHRYVELPAQQSRTLLPKQILVRWAMATAALCAAAGAVVWNSGFRKMAESSKIYRDAVAREKKFTDAAYNFAYNCQLSAHDPHILAAERCVSGARGRPETRPVETLLWGDSQAAHYVGVLSAVAEREGFRFRNATHSTCPPLFGEGDYGFGEYHAGCDAFRPYMRSAILAGGFKTIVLGGMWSWYDKKAEFRGDFERTIVEITRAGARVIILGEVPIFDSFMRECELRGLRVGGMNCQGRFVTPDSGDTDINRHMAGLAAAHPSVSYLDIRGVLCRDGKCDAYLDGRPVYFNGTHLSMDGSWLIGGKVLDSPARAAWREAFGPHATGDGQSAR